MTLPQRTFKDPLDVLLRAEEETCKGCKHREPANNGMKDYCDNPLVKSPLAVKRCEHYEEAE